MGARGLSALLFCSGAAALVLEVAWFRRMAQVSGATAVALGAVLAAVIGGMAVGALLFGRRADRSKNPIRLYALLELGVGVCALLSPWVLGALEPAYAGIHRTFGGVPGVELGVSFVFSMLVLALPAVLMGGTLPAAAAGVRTESSRRGRDVGSLYAWNTLGGVCGTLLAGFLLLPAVGLSSTMRLACLLSLVAAGGALLFGRGGRVSTGAPGAATFTAAEQKRAVALYAASGFLGLAAEVAFTRGLVLVFGSTTYAFSTVLAVFLFGIGAGSLIGARLVRTGNALRRLETLVPITAVLFSLSGLLIYFLPRLYLEGYLRFGSDFHTGLLLRFLLSAVVLLPGALALGIAFPLGAHVAAEAGLGRGTARLYAWNTIASVVGSTLTVFLLVPLLGPQNTAAFVALMVAAFVVVVSRRPALLLAVGVAALGLIPPSPAARERLLSGIYYTPSAWLEDGRINEKWWREGVDVAWSSYGREATATLTRWYGRPSMLVDGKAVASEQLATDVQHLELLGHLPMAVHPDPQRALVIGLGMGTSYRAVALHEPKELVVVEIAESVAECAARLGVKPKRLVVTDARTFLRATDERFDVITSDPIHPWVRGGGDLYSVEYYRLCRDRLAEGGVMCQWVPLYQMGYADVRDVVRTFLEVFETHAYFTGADLVLVGSVGAEPPAPRTLEGVTAAAMETLGAPDLSLLFLAGEDVLREATKDAAVLEDDALRLEFSTPRQVENPEMAAVLDWVRAIWPEPTEPFLALLEAQRAQITGDGDALSDALDRASREHPDNGFVKRFAGELYLRNVGGLARAGNVDTAERFLGYARSRLGDDPRLIGVEADLAETAGQTERAVQLFENLLQRDPDSAYLRRRIEHLRGL